MRFEILGPLRVHDGDRRVQISGGLQGQLLGLLLSRAGGGIAVVDLIDGLWGSMPPQDPYRDLRVNVTRLRRNLGAADRVKFGFGRYAIRLEAGELDAVEFEDGIRGARMAYNDGDLRVAADLLDRALRLWRGAPFDGLENSALLATAVQRLTTLRVEALERRAEINLDAGEYDRLVIDLPGLIDEYPYHERFVAQLMIALENTGRRTAALATYRAAYRRLGEDHGVTPSAELAALHQRILLGEQSGELGSVPALADSSTTSGLTDIDQPPAGIDTELPDGERRGRHRRRGRVAVASLAAVISVVAIGAAVVTDPWRPSSREGSHQPTSDTSSRPPTGPPPRTLATPPSVSPTQQDNILFRRCGLMVDEHARYGVIYERPLAGMVMQNYQGTTVVIRSGNQTWTCNLEPARTISPSKRVDQPVGTETLAVSLKPWPPQPPAARDSSRPLPLGSHVLIWGGGVLPKGYRWITFVLPNGVQIPAETNNGYWAVQTITPEWGTRTKPIEVRLSRPNMWTTEKIKLRWIGAWIDRTVAG